VPKTLLAVDDSATMRKVLEITFGGEDLRVVTADGPASALAKMSEEPVAVVIDTSLDGGDGYALAKDVRSRDARAVILLMASRYNPYDANRGRDAGVDDFIDKPFDTQAFIDKVKKAIAAREAGKAPTIAAAPVHAPPAAPVHAPPPPPPPPAPPIPAPVVQPHAAPVAASPFAASTRTPGAPPVARPAFTTQRTHTLSFEGSGAAAPPAPPHAPPAPPPPPPPPITAPPAHPVPPISRTAPSGVPVFQQPAAAAAAPPASRGPEVSTVIASVNGQLAGKLGELGLTPAQAEAVLALSREVVERVVWEVVPQLAETIIKEEIARLTKD